MKLRNNLLAFIVLLLVPGCGFTITEFALTVAVGGALAAAGSGGSGGMDSPRTGFEGMTGVATPPPETTNNSNTPAITNLAGPGDVYQGETAEFSFDFTDPDGDVVETLVCLDNKAEYYVVDTPTTLTAGTINVSLTLIQKFSVGDYFFKFALRDNAGNISNYLERNVTVCKSSPPEPAHSPAPANGTDNVSLTASLFWTGSDGTEGYYVYFDTDANPQYAGLTNMETFNPGALAYDTTYFWRVIPYNQFGNATSATLWYFRTRPEFYSPPAATANPSPADMATDVPLTTDLAWVADENAQGHYVFFGVNSSPPYLTTEAGNSTDPGALEYATTYFWRVVSYNSAGNSSCSEWLFVTEPQPLTPPDQVAYISPSHGSSNVSITPALEWQASPRASSYRVWFGASDPPSLVCGSCTSLSYNVGALDYTTQYYWRVDAVNTVGSANGSVISFITTEELPQLVTYLSPVDGADNVSGGISLSWNAAARADCYRVYLGKGVTPSLVCDSVIGTTFSPGGLSYFTTYYWKVSACNTAGVRENTVTWHFTTAEQLPARVQNPVPSNGEADVSLSASLQWSGATRADCYDVYFGTLNPPTALASADQTATALDPGGLSYDTTYYWRVDSKNTAGETTGDVWSFATETGPSPDSIYVSASGDNANDGSSWTNAVDNFQRALDLVANNGFILIADGVYSGAGNAKLDLHDKSFVMESVNGADSCVVDAGDDRFLSLDSGDGDDFVMDGLTFQDSGGYFVTSVYGGVFYFNGAGNNSVIKNCKFINNRITNNSSTNIYKKGGGAVAIKECSPSFINCLFYGNEAKDSYGGAVFIETGDPLFVNCTFALNEQSGFGTCGGVFIKNNSNVIFRNCILYGNDDYDIYEVYTNQVFLNSCCYGSLYGGDCEPDAACVNAPPFSRILRAGYPLVARASTPVATPTCPKSPT